MKYVKKTQRFVRIDLPRNVIPNLRPVVEAYKPYKKNTMEKLIQD